MGLVRGTGGVNLGTHLLGVKANNERRDVDDLLSNTERRGTSRGKEREGRKDRQQGFLVGSREWAGELTGCASA